jgi:exonuclease SbcC
MFKFLRLENYKSHENSLIHFDRGVNVIFGMSQAGKTNFLKALRLLASNRPLGGKFFSDFAGDKGETKITLGLEGSEDISLLKEIRVTEDDKKVIKTMYKIGDVPFSSPKDQVPDRIVAALNISELNIQRQFDPPFLVTSSGGDIAKTINRLTKLEEVDDWVSELTSEINAENRDIVRMESEAKALVQELEIYKDVDETEKAISELQANSGSIAKLLLQQNALDKMLIQFEEAVRSLEPLEEFLLAERYIIKAEKIQIEIDLFNSLQADLNRYKELSDTILEKKSILNDLSVSDSELESSEFDTVVYDSLKTACHRLSSCLEELEVLEGYLQAEKYAVKAEKIDAEISVFFNFKQQLRIYEEVAEVGEKKELRLSEAKIEYVNKLKEVKKCPICLADINVECIKEIEAAL